MGIGRVFTTDLSQDVGLALRFLLFSVDTRSCGILLILHSFEDFFSVLLAYAAALLILRILLLRLLLLLLIVLLILILVLVFVLILIFVLILLVLILFVLIFVLVFVTGSDLYSDPDSAVPADVSGPDAGSRELCHCQDCGGVRSYTARCFLQNPER